ncbi:hypothetical protein VM1G_01353 [Cytospora mali]|uniref:SGNH hydrolase-type esterase domain-containing protein n=1 Tax=Cytospora mali TaxID=578113 RepID=A0A194VR73_CYTMA|nr:hypothetical protein VM1G_01353 [Valsa mali]
MATTTAPSAHALPSPSLSPETNKNNNVAITSTTAASAINPTSASSNDTNGASPPSPQKPKRSLRILCFGDSLTSGYACLGTIEHPYSQSLTRVLSTAFPRLNIEAHTDGLPGDVVVSGRFLSRIEPKFLTKGGGTPYDWTVILGGTNDLAYQYTSEEIYKALRDCWDVALSKGGRVLACTIPEAGVRGKVGEKVKAKRDAINDLIRSHRQENFFVFDLASAIPFWSLAEAERNKYWDDHIHLTSDGYDLMGEKIAARLVELIMPPGRLQPQANGDRSTKRRRVFKDDDKVFEEEVGDDNLLDQGYYVVRRKDLE